MKQKASEKIIDLSHWLKLYLDVLIMEFLYDANMSIFDWFCFKLKEKGVFISKYKRKV